MNKQVKQWLEEVRLTDEDIIDAQRIACAKLEPYGKSVAQAQLQKILNHPRTRIRVDRELPTIPEFQYDNEAFCPYLKRGAINYSKMLAGYEPVISTREADND